MRFLILISVMLVAFAAAMSVLFKSDGELGSFALHPECDYDMRRLASFDTAIVHLFELSLSGEVMETFKCMRNSHNPVAAELVRAQRVVRTQRQAGAASGGRVACSATRTSA